VTQHAAARSAASRASRWVLWATAAAMLLYDLVQVVDLSRTAAVEAGTERKLAECIEIERTERKRERPPEYLAPERLEQAPP
jgi:hypothetical protein